MHGNIAGALNRRFRSLGRRDAFFVEPIVERAYQEAKGAFAEEGTVRPK